MNKEFQLKDMFKLLLKKSIAFTLAETLMVLGIIGVVAALTLPNLNSSTNDMENVARVKKVYQELTDAFGRAVAAYGPYNTWFRDDGNNQNKKNTRFAERMLESMKVSKNCGIATGCFSNNVLLLIDGSNIDDNEKTDSQVLSSYYKVILADGTSVAFSGGDSISIRVDLDGPNKGQNREGYDIFGFNFDSSKKQLIPDDQSDKWTGTFSSGNSPYYTAWVIRNGNMDYKKCNDLNWETKTSCK